MHPRAPLAPHRPASIHERPRRLRPHRHQAPHAPRAATAAGTLRLTLNDGREEFSWESDPFARPPTASLLLHHVVITVDGGPKIISFVVDGVFHDGGDARQFGGGRFSPSLRSANGAAKLKVSRALRTHRLYSRALRTSEAVGNYRAGPTAK